MCPSYIILSGLPWKIALHQKPSSSSSAATTSWSILMGGFLELSYGLSFLLVTILASTFQFLSSKNLYQKRSEDFPGVRTILKTYPDFLLNSIVTFPHHVHLPILLTSWDYAWMKWPLQSVGHFALEDGFHVLLTLRREKWSFAFPIPWKQCFPQVRLQNLTLLLASHTQMCMICLELKYFLYLYSFLWWNVKKFANFWRRDLHKWATQVELDVLQAKAVATFIWIQWLVRNNSTFISRHFLKRTTQLHRTIQYKQYKQYKQYILHIPRYKKIRLKLFCLWKKCT